MVVSVERRRPNEALAVEIAGAVLVAGLNVLANRLPWRVQIPANLAAAGLAALLARVAGVTWREQGLDPRDLPRGAVAGVAAATALATVTAAGLLAPGTRRLSQEERIVRATTPQMLHQVLVRIPLATALPEELIFRGALLGLLAQRRSPVAAAGVTSLLFGLWHVLPTADRIHTNPATRHAHGDPRRTALVIAGHVAATSLMGLGLAWLRLRSRSVLAPVLAHATPNAVGFLGGWTIARAPRLRTLPARMASRIRASLTVTQRPIIAPAPAVHTPLPGSTPTGGTATLRERGPEHPGRDA
jgi:uncharacterized protein